MSRGAHRTQLRPGVAPLLIVSLLAAVGSFLLARPAAAAPSDSPDETWVTDGRVNDMVQVGDRVYLGGSFRQVGPNVGFGVALSPDNAMRDVTFPKVDGRIWAAVADGEGGWYIGGEFSKVGSQERLRLAHILADGEVSGWNPGANSTVRTLALSPDGSRVYAGGAFTKIGTSMRSRLAAIDAATGALNSRWNPRANATVYALALSPDGRRIYTGGAFTTLAGGTVTRNRLAALDNNTGAADPTWNPNANGAVTALELSADGTRLFAGGDFTVVGGAAHSRLAAIDSATGADDGAWNPSASDTVNALKLSADGSGLYSGGAFTSMNGTSRNRLALLDTSTGAVDASWDPRANGTVYALFVNNSRIYVGGAFTTLAGGTVARNRLAAIDSATGRAEPAWDPNANGAVYALSVSGGRVYAGGTFTSVNGVSRDRLAAIDVSTGQPTDWNPKANSEVHALALSTSSARLYVGGGFTRVGGAFHNRLAAIHTATGAVDSQWNAGADDVVRALAVTDGRVYLGGKFLTVNGESRRRLASVDETTGGLDPNWAPAARGGDVQALVASRDGARIYAGGGFTEISGESRLKLAALNATTGALDPDWQPDPSFFIWDLAVSSTHLYAAGAGVGGNLMAFDTTRPVSKGQHTWKLSGDGDFQAVVIRNGEVYAGGHFDLINGQEVRHRLLAVDEATGTLDPTWRPSLFSSSTKDLGVWAMTGESGPRLYMGGDFLKVAGQVQQGYAQFPDLDKTAPTVVETAPQDGAREVLADTNVEATFSEDMDSSTLNGSTFTLTKQGSARPVEASLVYDPSTRKATLDPSAELEANATYTALLKSGGASDVVGNPLASDASWSFSTADDGSPETTIESGPDGPTSDDTPTFSFSGTDSVTPTADLVYSYRLDAGEWSDYSPETSVTLGGTGGLGEGPHTFYVKAKDQTGFEDETPAERGFTVDRTAPETAIVEGPTGTVNSASATLSFSSSEPDPVFECSLDGAPFELCASPQTYAGLAGGGHTFEVRALDAAGNTDASPDSRAWSVDATAPVVQPVLQSLVMSATLSTVTVPVRLDWSASDDGSGVSQYQLQQSTNGGSYAGVSLSTPTTTARNVSLSPANAYQFRVRATDGAGNWSEWSNGAQFVVDARQENSDTISYGGAWTLQESGTAYGGSTAYAISKEDSAQLTFWGTNIAWVAPKGPDRGRAEVWIDSTKVSTVDLYSSSEQPRKMVFTRNWAEPGPHTVEVRVLGTKNAASIGTRVDLDAFVVLGSG